LTPRAHRRLPFWRAGVCFFWILRNMAGANLATAHGHHAVSARHGEPQARADARRPCRHLDYRKHLRPFGHERPRDRSADEEPPMKTVRPENPILQGEWRRRESNPRPRTHRKEPLQACPAIRFRPPAGCRPPTDGLAILWESHFGRLALPPRQARCWRRIPSHGPKTERRRYLTRLGGECEIVLRTCFVPGCFTRPTGDLGLQLFRRTDHVETRSPPDREL
jgi:hypothetical protein